MGFGVGRGAVPSGDKNNIGYCTGKGKVYPRIGHEGPEEE
jgi:hypothetical protein